VEHHEFVLQRGRTAPVAWTPVADATQKVAEATQE
jgi:hypothetical protein